MNLINLATASDGDVRLALSVLHRIQGMCFELGFRGDDERGRAYELRLRREPRRLAARRHFLPGLDQPLPRSDDGTVGGHEMLPASVRDGSLAFLDGGILHGETPDAAVVAAALLLCALDHGLRGAGA